MENSINKSKILIVDDEEDILRLLSTVLRKEGFENIYTAAAAKEAIDLVSRLDPDIILLDIMMPDRDGYDVCKEIRKTSRTPILFMSAKSEELDRILGFALGADDYITKPFSPKEVAYRVKAHLRRNNYLGEDKVESGKPIVFGPFELNEEKIELKKNGELIELKAKEFKMLVYFAKNPNQILSKEKICDGVWGEDYIGFDNTIMVHIRRLREKIEDNPSMPKYIVNIKGLGYKFVVKDE
ncbi:response regulator transcription factor [Clostridium sp. CF012]|uniref:response regulator transcription factor n=1 Tax=Clostridium sp. CF012 TaxID=2843319 RepID=UPI001C0BC410|nr:response regulator transcription factor [Clostridium sp. CF012]MBU3145476.1 response regulator transcription factor [Clostridium sp. CF012]